MCSAQRESAGKEQRSPLSKKRNKHLQTMLAEAANLAPRWKSLLMKQLPAAGRNCAANRLLHWVAGKPLHPGQLADVLAVDPMDRPDKLILIHCEQLTPSLVMVLVALLP
ncbi:MAG: hypothetical protein LC633_03855 [Desulfobulbaceae bacterium]|nr:hypothetical protein [Desulfobulbaceae bacterium]